MISFSGRCIMSSLHFSGKTTTTTSSFSLGHCHHLSSKISVLANNTQHNRKNLALLQRAQSTSSTTTTDSTTRTTTTKNTKFHRIILCRHGLSMGNVDDTFYVHTADWKIPLSSKGKEQGRRAGQRLAKLLDGERCFVYHSPYLRATETMKEMVSQLPSSSIIGIRPEPRIVEQQFGNFQNYEEVQNSRDERVKFGRFFYRFPSGEAGLDVYLRITSFISTLFRESVEMQEQGLHLNETNIVLVTHGLTLRLFLMRWLQIDVEEFETMYNPDNGFLAVMECKTCPQTGNQWYELTKESADHLRITTRMAQPLVVDPNEE